MLTVWFLFLAVAQQLGARDALQLFTRVHPAMGTDFTLYIYAADAAAADREADRAFAIVDQLESLLSNYQAQSELSRINANASAHAVTTDPETFRFLKESLAWSARSNGAFDITVGKLMKAWGFFRSTGHVPSDAELGRVRAETGWKRVVLSAGTRTVRFTTPGVELDPGGIGKGFAVDAAIQMLRADGVHAAMLSAGSSTIYGLGAPPDAQGWKVRVPDPQRPNSEHRGTRMGGDISSVVLHDTSLSTANCSEKHFAVGGHQYCHIMDPRTLRPVEGRLQATVIAPSATDSDALSNAMFVLDAAGRRRLMQALPAADAALVVLRDGVEERYRWGPAVQAAAPVARYMRAAPYGRSPLALFTSRVKCGGIPPFAMLRTGHPVSGGDACELQVLRCAQDDTEYGGGLPQALPLRRAQDQDDTQSDQAELAYRKSIRMKE